MHNAPPVGTPRRPRLNRWARSRLFGAVDWFDRRLFPEAKSAGEHWQRVAMNRAVDEFLHGLDLGSMSAAEISGDTHVGRPWGSYTALMYPEFDICALLDAVGQFDVVICEQVLEHVTDPRQAVSNLHDLCRPGGYVVITSPFLIKVHELPKYGMFDYWRFTPRGLQLMLETAGFELVDTGQWGNRMCVTGNLSRWSAQRRWHPMRNEADIPLQIWAFARRPVG